MMVALWVNLSAVSINWRHVEMDLKVEMLNIQLSEAADVKGTPAFFQARVRLLKKPSHLVKALFNSGKDFFFFF